MIFYDILRTKVIFYLTFFQSRYKVLESLKTEFGPSVCPIVVPFVQDGKVDCYVNLLEMRAYRYGKNGIAVQTDMPDSDSSPPNTADPPAPAAVPPAPILNGGCPGSSDSLPVSNCGAIAWGVMVYQSRPLELWIVSWGASGS